MIIECERCNTKFNLNESLLKDSGSKVRCSICEYVFTAFPPQKEIEVREVMSEETETRGTADSQEKGVEEDLIAEIERTMVQEFKFDTGEEKQTFEPISFEDISQLESGVGAEDEETERPEIATAFERADKAEQKAMAEKEEERVFEKDVTEPLQSTHRPVAKKKRRWRLWIGIFLLLFILIGAAVAILFFRPDFIAKSIPFFEQPLLQEETFDVGNKRLSFHGLTSFFVESSTIGKLFIVNGMITNNYPDKRSYIRIKSNILDSQGKVAASKIVYAGNPMDDDELKNLSMEEIEARLKNKFGKDQMNVDTLPNASIPFMVVFSDLPDDMSEFTVEAIGSTPSGE